MTFENMTQKKLKLLHLLSLGGYAALSFIVPIVITIVWACNSSMITNSHRFPLIIMIIIAVFSLFAIHFLKKSVDKIPVLDLNGEYNKKACRLKAILRFICNAIIPIILIIGAIVARDWLVKTVGEMKVYINIIITDLASVIIAKIIDAFVIDPIEFELELRAKVASNNAVQRRVNNLTNIE